MRAGFARFAARAGTLIDGVPAWAVDLALAVVALVLMAGDRITARSTLGGPSPVELALTTVIAGGLALRRRAPLTAYAVGTAALAAEA